MAPGVRGQQEGALQTLLGKSCSGRLLGDGWACHPAGTQRLAGQQVTRALPPRRSCPGGKQTQSGPASGLHQKAMECLVWGQESGGSARGGDVDGRRPLRNKGTLPVRWSVVSVPEMLPLVSLVLISWACSGEELGSLQGLP